MKNIYMCLVVALLQFSSLEGRRFSQDIGLVQPRPGKDILIYKPSSTFPNPKPDYRFRRDVEDTLAEEDQVDFDRHERSINFNPYPTRDNPVKPHILINRPSPTIPEHDIRIRRATFDRKRLPEFGQPRPGQPDILIYRPSPTFPNPKPDFRFRREAEDLGEEVLDDQSRDKRQVEADLRGPRIKPVGADDLTFRQTSTFPKPKPETRFRRDVGEDNTEDNTDDFNEDLYREKRSFAPGGGPSFPSSGKSPQGSSGGSWGVSVNKDKGRGPQVRTEGQGNIYTSPKGNVRVDGHGHHEFGKGRKPDYGGGVKVGGRWRRDATEDVEQEQVEELLETDASRTKRFAPGGHNFPGSNGGQQQDRGSWGVTVNKDKGRGPQVHTEGKGNIYTSPNGNVRVDGHGHHEFGKGRKPDYGGGITVHGKWKREVGDIEDAEEISESERVRREANPQQRDRGSVSVNVDRGLTGHPQVRTDANYNIYTSPKGNWNVNGNGYHQAGHGQKPSYGAGVTVTGRFRREVSDDEDVEEDHERERREASPQKDRGSVSVNVDRGPTGHPQVRTDANYNIYTSPKGNWNVNGNGYHQAGHGQKPSYGAGVTVTGRFRRDISDDEDVEEDHERERREASPQKDRGSVSVNVDRGPTGHPQVRTDANYNIYTSPNGNWNVNGNGYHQAGHGQKPSYGAGVTLTGRFRRDVSDDEEIEEGHERERREANPQKDRGSVSVSVDKGPRGPQVRTDANYNIYTSPNKNWNVQGNGYHQAGRGQKPSYGAGVTVTGRFRRDVSNDQEVEEDHERERREANPQKDRGSVSVSVDKGPRGGPQVRTDANYNMYRSRNGNWELNGNAYHQAGRHQKPTYGAGVSLTGRFRRDAEEVNEDEDEQLREKREANPQKDPKGSVNVSINKDKGRGPQIRTEVERNIYTSRDKSFQIQGGGYHEAGKGRKPDYGGRVTFSKRF